MLLAACSSVLQLVQEIVDLRPCLTTVFVSNPNMPKLHSVYAVEEKNILHFCKFMEIFRNSSLAIILEGQYGSDRIEHYRTTLKTCHMHFYNENE
jgi:hypothetical protein